ncbi:MAG: M20 family metallopeptidase [Pseudomonadales bacterium]|nr:M20 family metallopeptidase [Pseudomonadales bacterium]
MTSSSKVSLSEPLIEQMQQWRRKIHAHPECGFEVQQTAAFVAEKLRSFGIEVVTNIGRTGLVGILRNGTSTASIGLRADMDALQINEQNTFAYRSQNSGKMHACGHDGHTSMLLGAAAHLAKTKNFEGTVYFIFQPEEEHGTGAQAMIDDGLFSRFDIQAVYGLHNLPGLAAGEFAVRSGALMASESGFEISIEAAGGHAAMPHVGVDPIVLGSQIVLALQTIVSRNLSVISQPAVVSVTEFITDGTVNVIPSKVLLKGDCRCYDEVTLAKLEQRMGEIVAGLCSAAGAEHKFEFRHAFYPLINSNTETANCVSAAEHVFGRDQVNGNCEPITVSEDFSSMLRVKPGCYALIGNGTESIGGCALHNPHYDFNDGILGLGASYWVQLVQQCLKT